MNTLFQALKQANVQVTEVLSQTDRDGSTIRTICCKHGPDQKFALSLHMPRFSKSSTASHLCSLVEVYAILGQSLHSGATLGQDVQRSATLKQAPLDYAYFINNPTKEEVTATCMRLIRRIV